MPTPLTIRIDTREQKPLSFPWPHITTVRDTVQVFDYGLQGDAMGFAVEYKARNDLVSSFATKDRRQHELDKVRRAMAAGFPVLVYVSDASYATIDRYPYSRFKSGRITSATIYARLWGLQYRYGVHVCLCGSRVAAARCVVYWLAQRQHAVDLIGKLR